METAWLLCSYRLPREPSRLRLAVWRRLRRLGAVMVHGGLWVLPGDHRTREDFEWLSQEIEERGGEVLLWEARSFAPAQDGVLAAAFRAESDARYAELAATAAQLARVARRRAPTPASAEPVMQRLRALERGLRQERRRDYFRAGGRATADAAIRASIEEVRARASAGQERARRAVGH
jgi:hypothetical protein